MKSLSFPTKAYLFLTYVAGTWIFFSAIPGMDLTKPWLLMSLCVLASMTLILKVEGSTNRSHYTFSFLVYGFAFAILGVEEAILVIVVSNLVEWIWNKPPWYIQLFNTCGYAVVMFVAGFFYQLANPSFSPNTWQTALGIVLSMAAFNFLNHLMVGIVIWFARGENLKQSGVFDFFPFALDLTLLYFGASLSIVWNYNPYALGLFLIPLYLIYSTLKVPALERKTEIDQKTGLFNHAHFKKQFASELMRANRFDRPISVILADLDLLRNINNTYGHLAGDEVLIGVARALKESVREYDVVCRFGGEEFAILLPETSLAHAYERAELLRKTVEALEFTVATSITPIRATMSFGISHREDFSQTSDEITHNADLALYHSKLSGRNRSFAYSGDTYVDFSEETSDIPLSEKHKYLSHVADTPQNPIRKPIEPENSAPMPVDASDKPARKTPVAEGTQNNGKKAKKQVFVVSMFIGGVMLTSLLAFGTLLRWIPYMAEPAAFDWVGLAIISILIIMSETFSIDLYIRQSSVSTSAIPILVAYLIFGPMGIAWASLVLAVALLIKYRSRVSRFFFNFSNHVLAGSITLALVLISGKEFMELPSILQMGISVTAAMILYLSTTWLVAAGMSIEFEHSAAQIWKEQFSWLAPYYAGIGFIAYAMIFGYKYDHVTGLLLMVIPMILLRISQKQYIDRTREVVSELREKNQILEKKSAEITDLNEGLLLTLSEIIDLRDPYVLGHSKQVSHYATEIARQLGLNEKQIDLIRKAGLLHDIGKLGVPMEILSKPGKLTQEEIETVREHAALGGDLVKNSPSLRPLSRIIRHHHEFYNGHGYPDKLSGNQITIEARIISVADAIEAMTSDRPYRAALPIEAVRDELMKHSGTQFDPVVVKSALKMIELEEIGQKSSVSKSETQLRISQKFAMQVR